MSVNEVILYAKSVVPSLPLEDNLTQKSVACYWESSLLLIAKHKVFPMLKNSQRHLRLIETLQKTLPSLSPELAVIS